MEIIILDEKYFGEKEKQENEEYIEAEVQRRLDIRLALLKVELMAQLLKNYIENHRS